MLELFNKNLHPNNKVEYFYRVSEIVTTFKADKLKNEPFSTYQDFKDEDLIKCRNKAIEYYNHRLSNLENNCTYFLPFANPENFKLGENAAFSINVSLTVCEYLDGESIDIEYTILGESEEICLEGIEMEELIFKELGITI